MSCAGLSPLADRIDGAFVYGSMAKGTPHANSDVDLMIVGSVGFAEAVLALHPAQEAMQREINPIVFGRGEFIGRLEQQDNFVATVWKGPKLWLLGSAGELG